MNHVSAGEELLFIFAGIFWSGVLFVVMAVMAGIRKMRAPKP
jgi:hypothetical protein